MFKFDLESYIASGLIPMPITMPDKAPAGGFSHQKWNKERPTPDDIRAVWARFGPYADGVALLCGHGLEMLDVDLQADPAKDINSRFYDAMMEEMPNTMEKMVMEKSFSGGMHFWYRLPQGYEFPSTKLARIPYTEVDTFILGPKYDGKKFGAILETRGRGGYGACAPTQGYELMMSDFLNLKTLTEDEHEKMWQIARSFNTYVEPQTYIPNEISNGAARPGEDYSARISVQEFTDMLESEGWRVIASRGDYVYLNRPGAKHSKRTDAVIVQSKKLFVPYSTSIPQFESEKGYSPFRTYALIKCGGDFKRAAKELTGSGYGEQKKEAVSMTPAIPVNEVLAKYDESRIKLSNRPALDFNLHVIKEPETPYSAPEMFGVAFPGALIGMVGKSKSRKTTVLTATIASALRGETVCGFNYKTEGNVLWIDTEQPDFYAWLTCWRILVQAGGQNDRLHFYSFFKLSKKEMKDAINALILALKPTIVVIDGIADLVGSINKEEDSFDFVTGWLRPLTFICNSTIFAVLHLNKSDGQMSGWIGTVLSKKADGTMQVDHVDDFSVDVSMREARAERFPAYRLYTEKGMHGILYKDKKPNYNYTIGYENEKNIAIAAENQFELEEVIDYEDIPF
jgi:hypothetical protein